MSGFDMDGLEEADPIDYWTNENQTGYFDPEIWKRKYAFTICGATGFTGQLCVQQMDYLLSRPGCPKHRWAIAGRDVKRLERIAAVCENRPDCVCSATLCDKSKLCHDSTAVLACAGPFLKYGEDLVKCCVDQWTHYLDITGEILFMRRMIDKYHQKAKERGVMLVFTVGQESAPYDIMCYKLAMAMGPLKSVRMYMFQYGNVSGGTAMTGLTSSLAKVSDSQGFDAMVKLENDPFALYGERKDGVRQEEGEMLEEEQDPLFPELWLFRFMHATTQVRAIRRTCMLFEESESDGVAYGRDFMVRLFDAAPVRKAAQIGQMSAMPIVDRGTCEAAIGGMAEGFRSGGSPPVGMGATEEARALYYSKCWAVGVNEEGKYMHVYHEGPDTYEITAMCAVSGILCLAEEVPPAGQGVYKGGCLTPAYAFHGTTWIERCERDNMVDTDHSKMTYDLFDGLPDGKDLKAAMTERSMKALKGQAAFASGEISMYGKPPMEDRDRLRRLLRIGKDAQKVVD